MRQRPTVQYRPGLESLESKQLMSVQALAADSATLRPRARVTAIRQASGPVDDAPFGPAAQAQSVEADVDHSVSGPDTQSPIFQVDRITNPTPINHVLAPPFQQVIVQSNPPIPGQ